MREMIIALIGVILTIFGFIIGMGALWYAKQQADKLADIHKTEMISLWAHIDRVHTLLIQIEEIAEDEKFIESGSLNSHTKQIIPKIFKGLSDEYVRIAALIIMKNQDTTIETINAWEKAGIIKTEWQKQRFINLIADSYQQDREKDK